MNAPEWLTSFADQILGYRCDYLKVRTNPSTEFYPVYGTVRKNYCSCRLDDHNEKGCAGTWEHSRCGGTHDCGCGRTRSELIEQFIAEFVRNEAEAVDE